MSARARENPVSRHASCVAFGERAVLICGPSGAGKSALALELIAKGAELVADDLTRLQRDGTQVFALAPPRLQGVIEARGVGLLRAPFRERAALRLVVDLGRIEAERLPHNHVTDLLGVEIETIYGIDAAWFAAAIKQLVTFGRHDA